MAACPTAHVNRLVSFDPYQTLGMAGVTPMKPEEMFRRRAEVAAADWVLFPEEWQLPALVYALKRRVFPSVPSYRLGQDKTHFTRALWALVPEHVPDTLILPATAEGARRALDHFCLPMVVKEPRSAMGVGVHRVETRSELLALLPRLSALYVQEYLEMDRDLRVVWVGDRVVAAYWRVGGDGFHHNLARGGAVDWEGVQPGALALVARVATALGIDHGGFDLARVGSHWYFLEVNVRFGNAALRQAGVRVAPLIRDYLAGQAPPLDPELPPFGVAV